MASHSICNGDGKSWKGRLSIILLAGIGILVGSWAAYKLTYSGLTTPPLSTANFETKYRNAQPQVRYVGDGACIGCHREMAEAYGKHPMARSLAPVAQADPVERYDADAHNPFDSLGFRYEIKRLDQRMIHLEKRINSKGQAVCELQEEVQYALGSGVRGRSYLVENDGFLFQSPASWYAGAKGWDLAAGYQVRNRHFNRPITAECLYCHANRAEAIDNSLNHFRTPIFQGYAIGCERCHGPGELHVQLRETDKSFVGEDDTIVVPDRLNPDLRESVCQQCHLQTLVQTEKLHRHREDYRPGLPLQQFMSYFVSSQGQGNTKRAVGQVEQMYASRCFQESRAKGAPLGCVTCHDPHHYPAPGEKLNYYRGRCLTCHGERDCRLEISARRVKNPDDNCMDCHMPSAASTNVAHTSITDHRIVRIADEDRDERSPVQGAPEKYPLVPFFQDDLDSSNPGRQRDLGVALVILGIKSHSPRLGQLALPLLDIGLQYWPDDLPALEAKGYAWSLQGNHEEALHAFQDSLRLAPGREWSLFGAAQSASLLGRSGEALTFWKRAIALNPWNWEYHDQLAKVYAARQQWSDAAEQCQETLRLNIAARETRMLLVKCLLRLGEKTKAEKEFQILLDFELAEAEALRRWFAEENR